MKKKENAKNSKRNNIMQAAVEIFAARGFHKATIAEIAQKANVSTGLIYSNFENKQDILLSIVVNFWEELNNLLQEKAVDKEETSIHKLRVVLNIIEQLLFMDKHSIYLAKVLGESLPLPQDIREAKLKEKRNKVMEEKRTFIRFIDSIIEEGQEQGKFDSRIPASVIRQVFYGAIELILYGLFLKFLRNENIGYDLVDAKRALDKLIEKFLP